MFIEETDIRTPCDRADGDLRRRLAMEQSRKATGSRVANNGGCACPIQPRMRDERDCRGDVREGRNGQDKYDCRGELRGGNNAWKKHDLPLAMVYSPYQHFRNVYDCEKGLSRGTIFRDLDKPFEASGSKGGCC